MKASNSILVLLVVAIWGCILIVGFVIGLRKTIKPQPRQKAIDIAKMNAKQKMLVQDAKDQQAESNLFRSQRLNDARQTQQQSAQDARQRQKQLLADQRRKIDEIRRKNEENRIRMRNR